MGHMVFLVTYLYMDTGRDDHRIRCNIKSSNIIDGANLQAEGADFVYSLLAAEKSNVYRFG